MKTYSDLTAGLQAVLLHSQRGYTKITKKPIIVEYEKVDSIISKWTEIYGINLPAWKRYQRKEKGLPNAVALVIPVLGNKFKRQLVLMSTNFDEKTAHKDNPFLKEEWTEKITIQDFELGIDQRADRSFSQTWRLSKSVVIGLNKFWVNKARKNEWSTVIEDIQHAVNLYPLFLGVRRQLRREVLGLKKLYEASTKKGWPGVDANKLPSVPGFLSKGGSKMKDQKDDT